MQTSTKTANAIRAELKKTFPKIEFAIRSKTYSLGSNVEIAYMDGVPQKEIEKLLAKYQFGDFDLKTKSYRITNQRKDIPQVKYVHVTRILSERFTEIVEKALMKKYKLKDFSETTTMKKFNMWPEQIIRRVASQITF